MTKYIINRILGIIPTLLIIITLSFFIVAQSQILWDFES